MCFAFWTLILQWCSMLPNDEEIINWSVSESEIFSEDDFFDEVSIQEVNEDFDDVNQEWNDEDNNENEENNVDVEFEVVD